MFGSIFLLFLIFLWREVSLNKPTLAFCFVCLSQCFLNALFLINKLKLIHTHTYICVFFFIPASCFSLCFSQFSFLNNLLLQKLSLYDTPNGPNGCSLPRLCVSSDCFSGGGGTVVRWKAFDVAVLRKLLKSCGEATAEALDCKPWQRLALTCCLSG